MGFEKEIKEQAAIASKRICCICKKFCGRNMEFHHIVPRSQGAKIHLKIVFQFVLIAIVM